MLEERHKDIGFIHSGIAINTQDAALDVEQRTDHGCLCEGDRILDSWLAVVAALNFIGGGDRQEESEKIVDLGKFHCRYRSRMRSGEIKGE